MIRRVYSALMVLLVSSAFGAAKAGDANPGDPGWLRTVSHYNVTFDEQGRSTIVFDFEIQALNDKGAEAIAQQVFPYNSYLSELSFSGLATLKVDGRLIAVDERTIRDQPASAASSPLGEERRRIIAYSHVAAGDRIRGRLTYKSKTADFAGEFADDGGAFAERRDRADAGTAPAGGLRQLPE